MHNINSKPGYLKQHVADLRREIEKLEPLQDTDSSIYTQQRYQKCVNDLHSLRRWSPAKLASLGVRYEDLFMPGETVVPHEVLNAPSETDVYGRRINPLVKKMTS